MIKVHLGCGKRYFGEDWIHIDGGNFPYVIYHDVSKLYFDNESVDLIYCCHLIAYFDREEIKDILKEWYRVLKPNGILRISTTDFAAISSLYLGEKCNLEQIIGPIFGKWKMSELNTNYIYQKTIYDFVELKDVLISAGFREVYKYDRWKTDHSNFDDHSAACLPHMDFENGTMISLNVEAIK